MENPIFLFFLFALVLIIYLIKVTVQVYKTKKLKSYFLKITSITFLFAFLFIWFVPVDIGWSNETPITKFRFQVFETELDNYGNPSSLKSIFFEYRPSRYGWMHLGVKVGGVNEYFGIKPLQMWSQNNVRYLHPWNTFFYAILNKNNKQLKNRSFTKVICVDCIFPSENEDQIYSIDYLLSKNAFDKYTYLQDEVLRFHKVDEKLLFSFNVNTLKGENYTEIFEFQLEQKSHQYKFKSTYRVP